MATDLATRGWQRAACPAIPASPVNTTDWFFAMAYEANNPNNTAETHASEYFRSLGDMTSTSYDLRASQLLTAPKLFDQYGYTITRSSFNPGMKNVLGNGGFISYSGSVQMSGWVSLTTTTGIISFGFSGPEITLSKVSTGVASLRIRQIWYTTYDVTSANFACPTDGTWFYLTLVVNGDTGVISVYVGTTLMTTVNTRVNMFNELAHSYSVNGNKRDFIMRKWTTGDTVFTPTRLLTLS